MNTGKDCLKDWSKLRRSLCSTQVSPFCFETARNAILGQLGGVAQEGKAPAKREDLRAIWDVTEDYWVVFGWTLDDYISADGSSYDTGIIYSVSSRWGPNGNAENPPTNIFFE